MAILEAIQRVAGLDPLVLAVAVAVLLLALHVVPWLLDPHGIQSVPGPFLAKFSDAWLAWVAAHGHRSEVVHRLHQRYGTHPKTRRLTLPHRAELRPAR